MGYSSTLISDGVEYTLIPVSRKTGFTLTVSNDKGKVSIISYDEKYPNRISKTLGGPPSFTNMDVRESTSRQVWDILRGITKVAVANYLTKESK